MAAIPTHDAREFLRFLRAQPRDVLFADDALLPLLVQQVVRRGIDPALVPAFLDAILLAHFTGDAETTDSVTSFGDGTPDQSHLTPQSPSPYPSPSLSPASPPLDPHYFQQQQQQAHNHSAAPTRRNPATAGDASRYRSVVPRDAFFRQFEPKTSSLGLCGYVFQRNDIAFNCKTCQLDETCVLCLQCYRNGNHDGHDIFFHRTFPGGCCDCGDAEAWDPAGFCLFHGDRADATSPSDLTTTAAAAAMDETTTPSDAGGLPLELLALADALFAQLVLFMLEMAKRSIATFDVEQVDAHGRALLREFSANTGAAAGAAIDAPLFHVRMCNDDVHSDEELVASLTAKHIPNPRDLVRRVDSNGDELVAANLSLRDALMLLHEFKDEGWHVCVVDDQHMHDERVLLQIIRWVKTIGSLAKPLLSRFYTTLFDASNSLSSPKEPIQLLFLSDPYFRKESVLELYELYLKLQGDKDPKLQFSVAFASVYSRMMTKYFCGVGTRDESLFQYGVQIFTTPSIVARLQDDGVLDMLLDTFNVALELAKAPATLSAVVATTARFLSPRVVNALRTLDCDHALLKFRRYTYATDHLGYVFNIPSVASDVLLTSSLLTKWIDAVSQVQGLDPQVRIQDGKAHVTFETELWFIAFSFHATLTKLQTMLVKGLRFEARNPRKQQQMLANMLACFWQSLDASGIADGVVLQLHTPAIGYVLGMPATAQIAKFDVASQPVSFHFPLHSMLASFLLEAMYHGPGTSSDATPTDAWLTDWKTFIYDSIERFEITKRSREDAAMATTEDVSSRQRRRELLVFGLIEYPLRTLVMCAQIQSGLWIRNGQSMHRQMVNYMSPPWCSELRDLDLFLLQISASVVGFKTFYTIYFDRFGLSEWLLTLKHSRQGTNSRSSTSVDEKLVTVLEAALLQLIWIVTELPPSIDALQQRDIVLRREIVHRLTQHPCRLSELLDQTSFMVSTVYGGMTTGHEKQHLRRLERILDDVADVQIKRSSLMSPFLPGNDASTDSDGVMEPNKYVLKKAFYREYDPGFYHLSRSGHEKAQFARHEALFKLWKLDDAPIPMVEALPPAHASLATIRCMVLEKGFVGILRLLLEDAVDTHIDRIARTNLTVVLRVLHLLNIVVLVLKQPPSDRASAAALSDSKRRHVLSLLRSGAETFDDDSDARGNKRARHQGGATTTLESESDVHMSSDSDVGETTTDVEHLSIVALLVTLARDQAKNDFDTSKSTISAIYWVLKELSKLDPTIYAFVEHLIYSRDRKADAQSAADRGLSKAELKQLHQRRAIEAMMARQKAFAASSIFADMQHDDNDDDENASDAFDALECDANSSSDGVGPSDHPSTTAAGSTIVYRPPPVPDCIICAQKNKDDPIMYIGHAQMSNVTAHAMQQPTTRSASDVPLTDSDADDDLDDVDIAGGSAAAGSSDAAGAHVPATATTATLSSPPLPFPPQLYLSLCGHAVHLHCWQKYFDSVKTQSEQTQSNVAFDAQFGEFLCPLCQALSSMVVPYVPLSRELTLDDRNADRAALEKVFQAKQDTTSILRWIAHDLPARLEALANDNRGGRTSDVDIDDDDDGIRSDDDVDDVDEQTGRHTNSRAREDVRAMKQFAISFLETLLRFQPDLPHVSAAMSALKSGFLNTGPQLAHIIWSAVASTCTSVQLSGMSSAIYSLEAANASTNTTSNGTANGHGFASASSKPASNAFSSLAITSLLNAPVPCMKTRLGVSLPESLDSQLDPFSPREDSKLNVLLRSLRRVDLLFTNRRQDFYHAIVAPIHANLRLRLSPDEWENALLGGPPLQLGQPILGQDLLYLSVAVCSSMLHTKAEILLTLRSFCVLHMAQVLVQLAREPAEEQNDEELHLDGGCSGSRDALDVANAPAAAVANTSDDSDMSGRTTEEDVGMQRALEQLMGRLSAHAGVDIVLQHAETERQQRLQHAYDGVSSSSVPLPFQRLRGYQLMYLFKSACAAFMRQVTLLCRAFFRGENDPDASWCANFVSSLRLSTNFYDLSQQLGVPTIEQIVNDTALLAYLDAAATQLQHTRFAAIPLDVQHTYTQTGHVDVLLESLDRLMGDDAEDEEDENAIATDNATMQRHVIESNLVRMPLLPFRRTPDANGVVRLSFAHIRLTRLAALYTDLHCDVLGKSKCKQTWRVAENPALCLACGEVLCAGSECCRRRSDSMGACTFHAITCGQGVGLFFLIRASSVLLVFGPRSSYFGSPYLDMFGEEDINIRRGRPLLLSLQRMKALQALYANHLLANEVARNRRTSEQYIRSNYY